MQAQHGFVELGVRGQNFLEVCLGHAKNGGVAVRVGIVRAPIPVEDGHVPKPDARLHIGQRDLLARDGGGADPHRAARAGNPLLGRIAAGGYEAAVLEAFDVCTSEDVVSQ